MAKGSSSKRINDRPIGVFDSGVGGLTVVRRLGRELPHEDIIYFGDTARLPYGNKSVASVERFCREIMDFLIEREVKFVIVACNTASSLALSRIREAYPLPVIGVISAGVKEAVRIAPEGEIGVIGTTSTIESGSYARELARLAGKARKLSAVACPLFVPLVENRLARREITRIAAEMYLKALRRRPLRALILGCTHYPAMKGAIRKAVGEVPLVDSAAAVSREVRSVLSGMGLVSNRRRKGRLKCFVSDDISSFRESASLFLRQDVPVKKVVL